MVSPEAESTELIGMGALDMAQQEDMRPALTENDAHLEMIPENHASSPRASRSTTRSQFTTPVNLSHIEKDADGVEDIDLGPQRESKVDLGSSLSIAAEPEYPSGVRLWIVMASLISSFFLIALDMTIVATAIPAITDEFGGIQDVAWYGAIFFTTAGGSQATWGKTYQYFDLKISFLTAIFIFEAGSLICGVAPTSAAFIAGRAIAGIGAAGVGAGCYTMIAFTVEPKKRPAYSGALGAVYGVGSVLGPLLGGVFSSRSTWRWCFYINLPIGVLPVLTVVFLFRTPEVAKPKEGTLLHKILNLDLAGTGLLMGAIITYLLAVHYGGQIYPWSSSLVVGLLVGSGLICMAFAAFEYWQDERAIVVPRLIRRRQIGVSGAYTILQSGAFFTIIYNTPIYFQAIRGSNPITSGVQNLPFIIAATLGAISSGIVISATGLSTLIMVCGAGLGTVGCGLLYMFGQDTPTGQWVGFQILAGVALGGTLQIPIIVGQTSVGSRDLASATSIMLCFQTLGAAIWVSAAQSVFVNQMLLHLPATSIDVDPVAVVATGAGQLRNVFSPGQLPFILGAYLEGIRAVFLLSCGLVGSAFLLSWFLSWKRLDTAVIKENTSGG